MNIIIGLTLTVLGSIMVWVCGLGITITLVAWICTMIGLPFIAGAGTLVFKFAGGWLVGIILTILGATLVSEA